MNPAGRRCIAAPGRCTRHPAKARRPCRPGFLHIAPDEGSMRFSPDQMRRYVTLLAVTKLSGQYSGHVGARPQAKGAKTGGKGIRRNANHRVGRNMPLRYTLRQLEYFVAVGETGSIAAASQQVNVSSPSISAGISQLEEELGVKLFIRYHAQGLTPTLAGRKLLDHAQTVLRQAATLRDLAGDLSGSVRGPLAIGCLSTFAQIVLPGLRRSFIEEYDEVRISQVEADQAELFGLLRQAKIDLALTYDLDLPGDLRFFPIIELPPLVAMSENHPLAHLSEVSVQQLAPHPMVLLDLPLSSEYFLSFFTKAGLRANISERTRDMAVMRSLVANGFGYSIVNVRPLHDVAPDGKPMRFLPLTGTPRPMKLGLLISRGTERPRLHKVFIDHARDWIERQSRNLLGLLPPAETEEPRRASRSG
jgi:DNA-binding transcriptional LysR family regulator